MVEEDEATKVLREELKKRLQASIIAYGDAGVMLHKFIQDFKEDHSKDLEVAAKRLGQDGVVQLLRMFPEYIRVIEQDDGHVKLRGIPTEDTKYNMNIISESNKAVERERMAMVYARTRQARARSIPTRIVIPPAASFPQTSAQIRPPPPPPGMEIPPIPASPPPAATYQFSFGMQPQQKPPVPPEKAKTPTKKPSRVTPPPPFGEVMNANRIPLGTRRPFSQQNNQQPPNLSRPSSQATGGYGHGGGRSSSMHAHRQQYQSHFSKSVPGRNDFGDTLVARCCAAAAQQRRSHPPPPPPAHLDENGRAPSAAKTTIEYHPDDYYEEDFRSPPSNKASNSTASGRSSGLGDDYYDDEDKSESESEFGDDEDLLESWNDDDHWDIDVQVDPARRDEDSVECFNFMDSKFGQQLRASAPSDLYRLVHLFRKNGGSYSKMDDLKKDYQQTFGTALTSKELNRMLGSPENVKIVKESFKKCAYPGSALFSITETANNYTVELLSSLAKDFVDSSIFFLPANAHQPLPCFSPPPLTPSTIKGSPTPSGTGTPTKRPQTAAGGAPSNTEGNNSSKGEQPFAALAILAHKELRMARKKRTLAELRRHILNIIKPGQFPQVLVESEANLLGYLLEFFRDSFSLEFQENNLYIMPTNVSPSYKFPLPHQPQSVYPFEGFMRADDIHRVTIVAQQDGPNLVLRLPEIKRQLAMCFSKYQGLMKAVADRPPVPLEPNYPIFYMFNGRLCRGRAVSQNAEDYATVSDLDAMNQQHFAPLKDIYAVDTNFPGWRYPPVDFCGRILNGEPSRLQQLAATKEEFPVRVMRVLDDGKCELKMVDEYDD